MLREKERTTRDRISTSIAQSRQACSGRELGKCRESVYSEDILRNRKRSVD